MIHLHFRLGFGIYAELNDEAMYLVQGDDEEGSEQIAAFTGFIIHIPLFAIFIGEFSEMDLWPFVRSATRQNSRRLGS